MSVVIPVYNEEAAITETLRLAQEVLQRSGLSYEIIVVNDGSTDRTVAAIQQGFPTHDVRLVEHRRNWGYGAALKTGIRYARHAWIAIVDADGSYPLEDLPVLLQLAGEADMVVGARTGNDTNPRRLRAPARAVLRGFAQWLVHRRIPDLNSGLRVFRKDLAERFLRILPDGFSFTSTITLALLTNGYRVHFEPIHYYRRIGHSKIRPVRDTLNVVRLIWGTAIFFAPFRVFLPLAAIFFLAFLMISGWEAWRRQDFSQRPLVALGVALHFGFCALAADRAGKGSRPDVCDRTYLLPDPDYSRLAVRRRHPEGTRLAVKRSAAEWRGV